MLVIVQAILLGIVQGLTEFIPISSSAHLIIVPWLFGWDDPALTSLSFDVALHMGTLIAVMWYFREDWITLIGAGIASLRERRIGGDPNRRLAWLIVLATIPGTIVGALLGGTITEWFHAPDQPIRPVMMVIMGVIVMLLGLLLFLAERLARHTRDLDHLTVKDSLLIGGAQALAIFPGVSRSGSTIAAGLGLGLRREDAARFSFLLSAPIILGAGLRSLVDVAQAITSGAIASDSLILFPIGLIAAAISGYLAVRFLMRYVQNHSTDLFVYYRWGLGVLIIFVALLRP